MVPVYASKSDIVNYYQWKFISYVALVAGALFWYLLLQKKTGVYGFFGLLVIVSLGVLYFQYESGYVPWYLRTYGGWR